METRKKCVKGSELEPSDLELATLELPSKLFFESSDFDSVELCLGTVELYVFLFGELE